jgi:malate/lactate dehydrogenase
VVVTNNFIDLRMQDSLEKIAILQDCSIVVNVIGEAIESICALFSHNQFGGEWILHHLYQKFMKFLPNKRKQNDDVVYVLFWPP